MTAKLKKKIAQILRRRVLQSKNNPVSVFRLFENAVFIDARADYRAAEKGHTAGRRFEVLR